MSDALRSIMQECEGHRFGQSGYDITLDHIYDMAEVALEDAELGAAWKARARELSRLRDKETSKKERLYAWISTARERIEQERDATRLTLDDPALTAHQQDSAAARAWALDLALRVIVDAKKDTRLVAGREVAGATPAVTKASRPVVELPETLDETLAVLDELWIEGPGFVQCGWRIVTARGHVVLRSDVDRPSAWNGGGHPLFVRRVEGPVSLDSGDE